MTAEEAIKKADSVARAGGWQWQIYFTGDYVAMIRLHHPLGSPCPLQVAAEEFSSSFSDAGKKLNLDRISTVVFAADYRLFGNPEVDALRAAMLDTFDFVKGTVKV